jgi:hypothetical protein
MARYRARALLLVDRLIEPGEEFSSALPPGRNWEPLDDEARAAVETFRTENAKVLSIVERIEADAVKIPENWEHRSVAQRRGLAQRLGAMKDVTIEEAEAVIRAEIERRGALAA